MSHRSYLDWNNPGLNGILYGTTFGGKVKLTVYVRGPGYNDADYSSEGTPYRLDIAMDAVLDSKLSKVDDVPGMGFFPPSGYPNHYSYVDYGVSLEDKDLLPPIFYNGEKYTYALTIDVDSELFLGLTNITGPPAFSFYGHLDIDLKGNVTVFKKPTILSAKLDGGYLVVQCAIPPVGYGNKRPTLNLGLKDVSGNPVSVEIYTTGIATQYIDLNYLKIPRFTENMSFDVSLTQGEYTDSKRVIAPLPIVLVSGIQPTQPTTGNGYGVFEDFTTRMAQLSQKAIEDREATGNPYKVFNPLAEEDDANIFYTEYPVNTATFEEGSQGISAAFFDRVKAHTYFDKFNLVGHSKGGLVSRYFIQKWHDQFPAGKFPVARFIAAQSPHSGAVRGAWAQRVFNLLPYFYYVNLLPVYPYTFESRQQKYIYSRPFNTQLLQLDGINVLGARFDPLPAYPTDIPTTFLRSSNHLTPVQSVGAIDIYASGDVIVPYFSQSGRFYDPNLAVGPNDVVSLPWLPSLKSAGTAGMIQYKDIDGSHLEGYLGKEEVCQYIFSLLFGNGVSL